MKKDTILDLYYVDKKYIRDLTNADSNVMSVSPQIGKNSRPFVGVIMVLGEKQYCIPLTSPKSKFNIKTKEDFIKIPDPKLKNSDGASITIGILNLNNMIPVTEYFIKKVDLSSSSKLDKGRIGLLRKEVEWCRNNKEVIHNKANRLYKKVVLTPDKDRKLTHRCCDFKKLEAVLEKKLEKEGIVEQKNDEQKLVDNIKSAGVKPTYSLIKNYKEINEFYKKEVSMDTVSKLYKNPELVPEDIQSSVKRFGDECKVQQQQRCQ